MNTNWSSPKRNMLAGVNDLRKCLASGDNARLIRARNEDCNYPIKVKEEGRDFRNYTHSIGHGASVNTIKNDPHMTEFQKHLTLNYVSVFGSPEAMKRYYETGVCDADNFKNMGCNHLVHVDDYIKFLETSKDAELLNLYKRQYRAPAGYEDVVHLFDFYKYKHGSPYSIRKFKHKLWVVELLDKDEPKAKLPVMTNIIMKIINVLVFPLKYVPQRSVLRMDEYTNYTYRIGSVVNGFSVEFQIPKKFSFKN